MEHKYDLKDLIEDPNLFEKAVGEYAAETLGSFKEADAVNQNADQLAITAFDYLKVELSNAADTYETMMLPFVKARFLDSFAGSVRAWQREHMISDFFDLPRGRGEGYDFVVEPAQTVGGLQYEQRAIEVVVLDQSPDSNASTVAYRYADSVTKEPWTIGPVEDAIDTCLTWRKPS
jgi:hypothetical protein